jgi:predicted oxidoreductase
MSNDYDPRLQALFTQAQQSFDHDAFLHGILERIDRQRRQTMMVWSVFGVAGIIVLALLAQPLFMALTMATQLLPVSLVEIETAWLRQLVSPINSVAAALAIAVLGIRGFIRRFLR